MQEQYVKWYTKHLSRDFEMLVFGHAGYPVILFPTSRGRYFENKDFKLVESASSLIDGGLVKIYCPDGIDEASWYNKSIHPADRVKTYLGYEQVIVQDVFDFARRETGSGKVAVAGCSFGAYHAANLAFRHPDMVGYLISLSGAFNIKQFLDGYYDENCYFNNPPDYVPGQKDPWFLTNMKQMGIVLNAGQQDPCYGETTHLSWLLKQKRVEHWLDIVPGFGHDWPWWREKFPFYVSLMKGVNR